MNVVLANVRGFEPPTAILADFDDCTENDATATFVERISGLGHRAPVAPRPLTVTFDQSTAVSIVVAVDAPRWVSVVSLAVAGECD